MHADTTDHHTATHASGVALVTRTADGEPLDAWFPEPQLGEGAAESDANAQLNALVGEDELRGVRLEVETVEIDLSQPVQSVPDAYLRLHLLSHLLVRPNSINLEGIFGQLPMNAWTNRGPMHPDLARERRGALRRAGVHVYAVDKFPQLLDYVTPERVRIADGARVRLGAHLAPGTVVMHEGFVNFNAGTLGTSMVEGRISQGVIVGDGSDIGGGASIMGTLSGGGKEVVAIGERTLLGANSGVGISIGDDCIVEAGLYVTGGMKVRYRDGEGEPKNVKASELSGTPNLLFRRNSLTGALESNVRAGEGIELNDDLHA